MANKKYKAKKRRAKRKAVTDPAAWVRAIDRAISKEGGILTNAQGPRGIHTVYDPTRTNKRRSRKSDKEKAIKDSEE